MRTSCGRGDNDLLAIAWARRGMWPAQAIDRAERYKFDCVVNMDFAPRTIGTHPCRCDPEAKSKLLQKLSASKCTHSRLNLQMTQVQGGRRAG